MVDYDMLESMLLEHVQKRVKISINGSRYRKGIFKLFKYHGEHIEFILDDNGRMRSVSFPLPFKISNIDGNIILSFKIEDYDELNANLTDKVLDCFVSKSAKYFNSDVILEWECKKKVD